MLALIRHSSENISNSNKLQPSSVFQGSCHPERVMLVSAGNREPPVTPISLREADSRYTPSSSQGGSSPCLVPPWGPAEHLARPGQPLRDLRRVTWRSEIFLPKLCFVLVVWQMWILISATGTVKTTCPKAAARYLQNSH